VHIRVGMRRDPPEAGGVVGREETRSGTPENLDRVQLAYVDSDRSRRSVGPKKEPLLTEINTRQMRSSCNTTVIGPGGEGTARRRHEGALTPNTRSPGMSHVGEGLEGREELNLA
jgi:hypothetical protein